jgi:hypothetical protein
MARSTKLERLLTDPLNTRLTTVENKVTTVETRSLVDEGDNVSVLVNDAGYQNATQVDTKIQAVVGAAPAALDTLQEIADALADDDSAIAALVAQDTSNAAAITALQTENTTQGSQIGALQAEAHEALTLGSLVKGLALTEQELSLKLDPSTSNLLTEATNGLLVDIDTVKTQLIPALSVVTNNVNLYVDNINGLNTNINPESDTTPVKTIYQALKYASEKYIFPYEDINLFVWLISDYTITENDISVIDGNDFRGLGCIKFASYDSSQKVFNPLYKRIIFQNLLKLTFDKISFSNQSEVLIQHCADIDFTGLTIFNHLEVKNCRSFFNSNGGLQFDGNVVFDSLENAEIYTNGTSVDCLINKSFTVKNVINSTIRGSLTSNQSQIQMTNVSNCIFTNVVIAESALNYTSDVPLINLNNVEYIQTSANLKLNSTTGLIKRPLLKAVNCSNFFGGLTFENTYTGSIVNQAVKPLLEFINSVIKVGIGIKSGSFSPCFSTTDATKKLIDLTKSSYPTGTAEATIKTSVYNTPGRPIDFDKYSDYLGENILDLRGRITRRTLTTDITLEASDTSRQHLINQSGASRTVNLYTTPALDQEFEVINNSTSTFDLIFAGETVVPGTRHAVQWDGVEWVVM